MSIAFGTRYCYVRIGAVADFCPLCRGIHSFWLEEMRLVYHLQYIRVSPGKLVNYHRMCRRCKIRTPADAGEYQQVVSKYLVWTYNINKLIAVTNPDVFRRYENRLSLEAQLEKGEKISNLEKLRLLQEPFEYVNLMVEAKSHPDAPVDFGDIFAMVGKIMLLLVLCLAVGVVVPDLINFAIGVFIIVLFVAAFRQDTIFKNRLVRKATPRLIRCIRVLQPSEENLREVFSHQPLQIYTILNQEKFVRKTLR